MSGKQKILIVDDDDNIAELISLYLTKECFDTQIVHDGEAALKAFDIYELKHKRGSGAFGKSWKTFDKFCWHENHNTSSDFAIFRFLIQLKLRMSGDERR